MQQNYFSQGKVVEFDVVPDIYSELSEAFQLPDSGNRTEFDSGAVRDIQAGKGRCDLLPLDVVGKYLNDSILESIHDFQKTGSVSCLYQVLWDFAPHWGTEHSKSDPTMILEVSKHYEDGCHKYGERNWEKGMPVRCFINSAIRHYLKFLRGDQDEPHDRAFVWNVLGAIWTTERKPELCEYFQVDPLNNMKKG